MLNGSQGSPPGNLLRRLLVRPLNKPLNKPLALFARGLGRTFRNAVCVALLGGVLASTTSCTDGVLPPALAPAAARQDALAISDGIEEMIDKRIDKPTDRWGAYDTIRQWPQDTAEYAFARAALAGRAAQLKGVSAVGIIGDMETWARKSIKLNPNFRNGAATRMLGTLYVLAPGSMVDHGDSEMGLEMLEELHEKQPNVMENKLRLSEAYIALDDHEPAYLILCDCLHNAVKLRPDDQRLLAKLTEAVGGHEELRCAARRAEAASGVSADDEDE